VREIHAGWPRKANLQDESGKPVKVDACNGSNGTRLWTRYYYRYRLASAIPLETPSLSAILCRG